MALSAPVASKSAPKQRDALSTGTHSARIADDMDCKKNCCNWGASNVPRVDRPAALLAEDVCHPGTLVADECSTPPETKELREALSSFYKQHIVVEGVLIVGSEKVSPHAMQETAFLIRQMLAKRPDALKQIAKKKLYIGVMAYNEMTTDLPEFAHMSAWWDKRARGLGGNPVTCGEENLLSFKGDPYRGENIFVHEFAHGLERIFGQLDKSFRPRLRELYEAADKSGRFRGYGMNNAGEFWAEGVQSWFNCNRGGGLTLLDGNGKRLAELNTKEQLQAELPDLAELVDKTFGHITWTHLPVPEREEQPHLRGYDPAKAPTFEWPAAVLEAFNRIEAEKRMQREDRGR